MDIGQYVGLFLLKNEYCYLPGIGSLQVIKRSANFNKETLNTEAPGYEIVFVKGAGSIDDTFANFIANNERISIAQAANHLKDYAAACKAELNEGNDVIIYGIGKFVSKNKGEDIFFETDADLRIQGKQIPYFKISEAVEEKKNATSISAIIEQTNFKQPKGDEEIVIKPAQVNWGKIILLSAIVVVLLSLIIYFVYSFNNNAAATNDNQNKKLETPTTIVEQEDVQTPVVDTMQQNTTDTVAPNNQAAPSRGSVNVVINSYAAYDRAEARVNKLKSFGYNASLRELGNDSIKYHAVLTFDGPIENPQKLADSIKRVLNPQGNVYIIN